MENLMFKTKLALFGAIISATALMSACSDDSASQTSAAVASSAPAVQEIKVTKWGPHGTVAGKGFSVQPNGDSALWFEFTGSGNAKNIEVWFGDQKLSGVAIIPDQGGSAQVPAALISAPKKVLVYLLDLSTGKKSELGTFEITPAS